MTLRAPSTTCALVRIVPSGPTMNPEPCPCMGTVWPGAIGMPKNRKNGLSSPKPGGAEWLATGFMSPLTLILTTAEPYLCTSARKSGSALTVGTGFVAGPAPADGPDETGAIGCCVTTDCSAASAGRVEPDMYSTPTGVATSVAPITAATTGLRKIVLTVIWRLLTCYVGCSVGARWLRQPCGIIKSA